MSRKADREYQRRLQKILDDAAPSIVEMVTDIHDNVGAPDVEPLSAYVDDVADEMGQALHDLAIATDAPGVRNALIRIGALAITGATSLEPPEPLLPASLEARSPSSPKREGASGGEGWCRA